MEDTQIIDLFWRRSEDAISETDKKYGRYCGCIAFHILANREDSDECVNAAYWKVWNAIPPHRPGRLSAFLGKITRNLALSRLEHDRAQKRGGGQVVLALEELEECIPDKRGIYMEETELSQALNGFLRTLPEERRRIFVSRYWGLTPVKTIAQMYGITEAKVKTVLFRTRQQLKSYLEQEGISV